MNCFTHHNFVGIRQTLEAPPDGGRRDRGAGEWFIQVLKEGAAD